MSGRGPQTFKKRQKEQQRKERQLEKLAKRIQRKEESRNQEPPADDAAPDGPEQVQNA
jgi:hypothetical protein